MKPCWEKNCKILNERYPGLLEAIARAGDDFPGEVAIGTAGSGAPVMSVNGKNIHSPRDPERESFRLASASLAEASLAEACLAEPPAGPVIVLGFGLGYEAQAVAELAPRRPVIIAEKYLSLLRKAFEERDLSRLLSRDGVAFVPGGGGAGIVQALSLFSKTGKQPATDPDRFTWSGSVAPPLILRNRALTQIDQQWYGAAENRIRAWAMRDDVNAATSKKFGGRWERNLLRNTFYIRDLPGIARLEGLAAQGPLLPVFLAAAGPGLDITRPLLAEIRKRCVIVAVDTSLRFLLMNGADPDFALVMDPQYWNSRHLDCIQRLKRKANTRLIAEPAAYPSVFRLPFKGAYLCGSQLPQAKNIERQVDPKGALGAGGSVATAAWDFSRMLGAREIWIAGLDLAFPGLRTHYRGALFEEKTLAESGRLNPVETWLARALRDGIPFTAAALDGGEVLTDRRLSLYAAWFEHNFRQHPLIRNYSLSSGGLAVPGLEGAQPAALLALPERRAEIDSRLEAAFSRIEVDFFELEETRRRHERYERALAG